MSGKDLVRRDLSKMARAALRTVTDSVGLLLESLVNGQPPSAVVDTGLSPSPGDL